MFRRGVKLGGFTVAFTAGIVAALIFPKTFLIGVLAILIICCCRK